MPQDYESVNCIQGELERKKPGLEEATVGWHWRKFVPVLEAFNFLIPDSVATDYIASKEHVSSKGNLGNNLATDGEDSWGQDTASGAGMGAM